MKIVEYSGLLVKYRTNRPLTEQERTDHLKQDQRLNVEPHYQLCVIKMNSTFLESVDKWFAWKGVLSLYVISIMIVLVGGLGFVALSIVLRETGVLPSLTGGVPLTSGIGMSIIVSCIALLTTWVLCKESFAYTHYPIRFNRRTRMVHVFRTDGSVLSVPWDQVYFTLGYMPPPNEAEVFGYVHPKAEVRGHVLDADNVTVRETFALSHVSMFSARPTDPGRSPFTTDDFARGHWEFVRRYMEDGPQQLSGQVESCIPIDGRREDFWLGARRIFTNLAGGTGWLFVMLAPLFAAVSLFRGFAMRTSKVPQWPKEIDAACVVEPDDAYAIEGDAQGKRVAVFPEAARMAGVAFIAPPNHAAS